MSEQTLVVNSNNAHPVIELLLVFVSAAMASLLKVETCGIDAEFLHLVLDAGVRSEEEETV